MCQEVVVFNSCFQGESQREMLKLLKPETWKTVRENTEEETENEGRSFYTPTKSVRINSAPNNDPCSSRNSCADSRQPKPPTPVYP